MDCCNALGNHDLGQFGQKLEKIYRYLLQLLALPLTPHGSHGLIEKQIHEICGRLPGKEAGSKEYFPTQQHFKPGPGTLKCR